MTAPFTLATMILRERFSCCEDNTKTRNATFVVYLRLSDNGRIESSTRVFRAIGDHISQDTPVSIYV